MAISPVSSDHLNTHAALGWRFGSLAVLWFLITIGLWFFIANGAISRLLEILANRTPLGGLNPFANVTELENWKNFGYFVGTLGVGPIAIYLASVRTRVAAEQLTTDRSKLDTDRSKLDTERERVSNDRTKSVNEAFAKSIELLGNGEVTVRQGAIYALARLAKLEVDTLHATIVRIFVSFVRERSKNNASASSDVYSSPTLSVDVEAALYAIRDRSDKNDYENGKRQKANNTSVGFLFDMSNSFLLNADLDVADLEGFNLSDSKVHGCSFSGANLSRVNFVGTEFLDCDFSGAKVHGANFSRTTGLTQEALAQTEGNSNTKLPENLTPPPEWTQVVSDSLSSDQRG